MDDPGFKSRFRLTLTHSVDFPKTYFNAPIERSVPSQSGDIVTDYFGTSEIMSTYQFGFVVSAFASKSATSRTGHVIEVAGRQSAVSLGQLDYALDETVKSFEFFSEYFSFIYPLKKLSKHIFLLFFFVEINF